MNKTTLRRASTNDKEKKKDASKAQKRLFNASTSNNNTKASVVRLDDDTGFNSSSMAAVSRVDSIDVNSMYNLNSVGAVSQVSEAMPGGIELQHITPSAANDVSSGDWVDWCDRSQEQLALQSVTEKDEDDEDVTVKVTDLVGLTVKLSLNLRFSVPSPNSKTTFSSFTVLIQKQLSLSLTFLSLWVHNHTSWQFYLLPPPGTAFSAAAYHGQF